MVPVDTDIDAFIHTHTAPVQRTILLITRGTVGSDEVYSKLVVSSSTALESLTVVNDLAQTSL